MVYSMTGYGKKNAVINGKDITVEIKSVNHRYFEYSSRISRLFMILDDKIKKVVSQNISRGKVEVSLNIRRIESTDTVIHTDVALAKSYFDALTDIATKLNIQAPNDAQSLAKYDGVLVPVKGEEDTKQLWEDVQQVLLSAIDDFKEMRRVEGEKLYQDIISRLDLIEQITETIKQTSPLRVQKYQERLFARLKTILEDKQIDESRILTEAAIFADKTAVDEETTRLESHISQYREILNSNLPQGRKLDFLTQELNRETNTIGSKSNDLDLTRLVVEIKSEIEKIREQVQNIE